MITLTGWDHIVCFTVFSHWHFFLSSHLSKWQRRWALHVLIKAYRKRNMSDERCCKFNNPLLKLQSFVIKHSEGCFVLFLCQPLIVCLCVCVCVCVTEREREWVGGWVCVCVCIYTYIKRIFACPVFEVSGQCSAKRAECFNIVIKLLIAMKFGSIKQYRCSSQRVKNKVYREYQQKKLIN